MITLHVLVFEKTITIFKVYESMINKVHLLCNVPMLILIKACNRASTCGYEGVSITLLHVLYGDSYHPWKTQHSSNYDKALKSKLELSY